MRRDDAAIGLYIGVPGRKPSIEKTGADLAGGLIFICAAVGFVAGAAAYIFRDRIRQCDRRFFPWHEGCVAAIMRGLGVNQGMLAQIVEAGRHMILNPIMRQPPPAALVIAPGALAGPLPAALPPPVANAGAGRDP